MRVLALGHLGQLLCLAVTISPKVFPAVFLGFRVPTGTVFLEVTGHGKGSDLFGLDCGSATVPTIIVAEGSIVDGIAIIVSHEWLTAFDTVDQSRVGIPLETSSADDPLYSWWVHPVGNVSHRHVHWQDDGLAVVIQARGDTL